MAKNKKRHKSEADKLKAEKAKKKRALLRDIKFLTIVLAAVALAVAVIVIVGNIPEKGANAIVPTEHAAIAVEGYGTLHVELYGNEAPETVAAFKKLAESGKYNGITLDKLLNGMLETTAISSTSTIKGEFSDNGVKNRVKHKKGVLSMVLPDGNDSATGEFFIVTETLKDLDGKSTAFGKITDMSILNKIIEDLQPDENGNIAAEKQPKITSISLHGHH